MVGNKHKELALCDSLTKVGTVLNALLERKHSTEYAWAIYDLDKALVEKVGQVFSC